MQPEEIIKKLKNGDKEEVIRVNKTIKEKLKDKNSFKKLIFSEILENMSGFSFIKNERNKIAFISNLKLFLPEAKKEHFPFFVDFVLENIEDDLKKVRLAVLDLSEKVIFYAFLKNKKRGIKNEDLFVYFIDEILLLFNKYYKPEIDNSLKGLSDFKAESIKKLLSKTLNPLNNKSPDWLDCGWRRVPCKKKDCPVCSVKKELDYSENFINSDFLDNKKTPKPEEFPFYFEVKNWIDDFISVSENSLNNSDFWIFTEEAADLFWYLNVLGQKVYSQLCNRYLIEKGEKRFSEYDYDRYVLIESIRIIKKSVKIILEINPTQAESLKYLLKKLSLMEERIFNI